MNALLNAHSQQGSSKSPHVGLTSNVLPEAIDSQKGVSSDYAQKSTHEWHVLRVTYNRVKQANDILIRAGVQTYQPMHHMLINRLGKKRRVLKPLFPNFCFVYAPRQEILRLIRQKVDEKTCLKFYLDKTKSPEANGKHPPLTIPFATMINFIRATSTDSPHVRTVSLAQCKYKSGEKVRITRGEFAGVVGRVARIAGQQRVVVDITGLGMIATAYIPTDFIETIR